MEYEFLKKNADEFLKNAEYLIERRVFNLAAFNIEQASRKENRRIPEDPLDQKIDFRMLEILSRARKDS